MIPRTIDELRADVARCTARTADWPRCEHCTGRFCPSGATHCHRCSRNPSVLHFATSDPLFAAFGSDIQYHGLAGDLQDILENIADRVAEDFDT